MMKVLKKILAVAVSVATMAMSVSAFAATYDADTTSVALSDTEVTTLAGNSGQMTVVVVPKTFGENGTVTADNIYYINQEEFGDAFTAIITNMGLKGALATPTDYEVRIGGANLAAPVKFDITVEGSQYKLGDVNRSGGNADILDASSIVSYVLGEVTYDAEQLVLGDTNKSGGNPDILDASTIVSYILGELDLYN